MLKVKKGTNVFLLGNGDQVPMDMHIRIHVKIQQYHINCLICQINCLVFKLSDGIDLILGKN